MSHKRIQDKSKAEYPWTARQRRMKVSGRLARKQERKKSRGQ